MQDCKPSDTLIAKEDRFSLSQCLENNLEVKEMQKFPDVSRTYVYYMLRYVHIQIFYTLLVYWVNI